MQQRKLHAHGAGEEVDVGRLARRRDQQLLALDAVAQVEQLALRADAGDGVGPLEAPLLAEDVELLEALVDVELLVDLALLLGDARQALGVLAALGLRRREACRCAVRSERRQPRSADAGGDQRRGDERRQHELAQLLRGEAHGSLRAATMVKRGASPLTRPRRCRR